MKPILAASIALSAASLSHAAVTMTAVRAYDSTTTNANAVESSAAGLMSVATFTANVASAYDNGTGGVATFDGLTGANNEQWNVSYGSGKTLVVTTSSTAMAVDMSQVAAIGATPISGNGYFRLTGTFANTLGFASNPLSSFGFTILARNNERRLDSIVVTFHDGSTQTLITGVSLPANTATGMSDYLNSPTSGPDIFFGFEAPTGKAIVSIAIDAGALNGGNLVIDDFGFITSPIPETSTAVLAMAGLLATTIRRRRLS